MKILERIPKNALICYLLAAAVLSVGVTLSRYVTSTSGSDRSQVAAFLVDASGADGVSLALDPAGQETMAEYPFTVTNQEGGDVSAIGAEYQILVELPEALPEGIAMELRFGGTVIAPEKTEGNTLTYPGAQTLPAGDAANHSYTLRFSIDDSGVIPWGAALSGIRVSVLARQID